MQISAGLCWLVAALILGGFKSCLAVRCRIGVRRGRVPYGVWL